MDRTRSSSPEELILSSIDNALSKVFDRNTMRAVDFYVDRHIAVNSPGEYAKSMQKVFGVGARVLIDGIIDGMCAAAGIERGQIASLEDCVVTVKAKLTPSAKS